MGRDGRTRIVDQFSYQGERAAIWKAFDLFLPTDQFLNIGYSKPYQPHFVGSSQRRLTKRMGSDIAARLGSTTGVSLLDVGCGRGGPTLHLAAEHGFEATGIDLVPYNVSMARRNAADATVDAQFVVGDALQLPFDRKSFAVCTAVDSPPYIPNKRGFLAEMASVTAEGGLVAVSDFVRPESLSPEARDAVDTFADAWDLAPIAPLEQYKRAITASDLHLDTVVDISPNSIARFRKWTALYLSLARTSLPNLVERFLAQHGIDLDAITEQVAVTHPALPFLRHVILYVRT
jgi:ubiquinone/menaquinone biosynthesis C-methylase UbiE